MENGDKLLTTAEVAARLEVSSSTVRNWATRGLLSPALVLPSGYRRFRLEDVDALRRRMSVYYVGGEPQP